MDYCYRFSTERFIVPITDRRYFGKKYRYRSAGTFTSQFLGGTRYFCKIFYNKNGEVCTATPSTAIV